MRKTTPPNRRRADAQARSSRTAGFTLIELMVVIVIIGILMALLIPVIAGAVRTARNAQVSSEMQSLSSALAEFKNRYGEYPPSRILLSESGFYDPTDQTAISAASFFGVGAMKTVPWKLGRDPGNPNNPYDLTVGQLAQQSQRILRRMFPKMAFAADNSRWLHDFNGNNFADKNASANGAPVYIYLEGHECLAFFLGGIPQPTLANAANPGQPPFLFQPGDGMSGFSKDPVFPFKNVSQTDNRYAPLYEFKSPRLVDEDGDGIPGYLDPLRSANDARFYAYFSAYGTNGYDPNDCNGLWDPQNASQAPDFDDLRSYQVTNGLGFVTSPSPNPYTGTIADPFAAGSANQVRVTYQNSNTFQILSAGNDGYYGPGGQYLTTGGDRLPVDPSRPALDAGMRIRERDNLTNFSNGTLE